jgi:hypothetical protein
MEQGHNKVLAMHRFWCLVLIMDFIDPAEKEVIDLFTAIAKLLSSCASRPQCLFRIIWWILKLACLFKPVMRIQSTLRQIRVSDGLVYGVYLVQVT